MKTHGMRKHPLYKTWVEMRYRCEKPRKHNFKYYGGRGIKVCDRWQQFPNFVADMGERPEGETLDRIDRNGDYDPSNCRWATRLEQANNTSANRKLVVAGEVIGLCEASRKYGVPFATIWARLKNGWGEEDAATKPVDTRWWDGRRSNYRAEGKIG